jgi:choline dehydrogenase-like flavoprotein
MMQAGSTLPEGGETEVDVAIVGAGPVGVAIATRLMGRVGRIALVEAGGTQFRPAEASEFFTAEEISDPRHMPTNLYRRRMLGGTTSIWGGRCTPFDPEDFASSQERPGWPIQYSEMKAHVGEALEFFDAGRPEYSATIALPGHPVPLHATATDLVVDRIERWSKPTDVWRKFGAALASSRQVTVIHGATCKNVVTIGDGSRAAGLELTTPIVRSHKVLAPLIVLACAGLEVPRLLLASRGSRSCGLGNEHDLVGRFYMAHLASDAHNVGVLRFAKPEIARAFDFTKMADGIYGRRMILLSPEVRRREGIGNIVFRPSRPPIDDASHRDPVLSAMFLTKNLLIPAEYMRGLAVQTRLSSLLEHRPHVTNVVVGLPKLCDFGVDWLRRRVLATRKLPAVFLYRRDGTYPLEFNAEQTPNPESRVLLGRDTDPFGMPRLVVQWRMRDDEVGRICRAYHVLAAAVARSGLGTVLFDADLSGAVQRALVPQGGVHIGTARMGADPASGVVDQNGEVWGTRGLFVAGTATFPTSGFASPTLTAVALAFRLAEHLIRRETATTAAPSRSV